MVHAQCILNAGPPQQFLRVFDAWVADDDPPDLFGGIIFLISFLNHNSARAPICSPLMKTQCEVQRVMSRLGVCNCLVEQLVTPDD